MIATPIGHFDDLTLRARQLLSRLQFIVCEDTRQTKQLLSHHNLLQNPQLIRGDEHTQDRVIGFVLEKMQQGHSVGFVSDAGTPGICDPGSVLVQAVRQAGYIVVGIPGASSVSTFLSICGSRQAQWTFVGFFPRDSGGLRKLCEKFHQDGGLWVGFESPHRIIQTLERCAEVLPKTVHCIVAKELTKTYENLWQGRLSDVLEILKAHPEWVRGEFILGLEFHGEKMQKWEKAALSLESELGRKRTANWIAEHFHTKSSLVYDFLTKTALEKDSY
jgi:16S rRNA (cytidine1402-2'-O)-methyltransferase